MVSWEGLDPPYNTIVVDPPWHYAKTNPDNPWMNVKPENRKTYLGGGLAYSSMTVQEITDLKVDEVAADDSRVFLWLTNRYLRHGWDILEAWGFEPMDRTLVWCKTPRGTMPVTTEFILMGKRGKPPPLPWHGTTWFNWSHQKAHSVKPAAFGDLVESWCPGPYVELFARQPRLGWDSWGLGFQESLTTPEVPVS